MTSAFTNPAQAVKSRVLVVSRGGPGDRTIEDSDTISWDASETGAVSASLADGFLSGYSFRKAGIATMVAGTVTVSDTGVTANSLILVTPQENGAANGSVRVASRVPGLEFVISSSNVLDDADVGYMILEP